MAKFTDFVVNLGSDPQAVAALRANPEKAMENAGLSAAEQSILLQGDPALIRSTIAKELGIQESILSPFYTITVTLTTVHVNVHVSE